MTDEERAKLKEIESVMAKHRGMEPPRDEDELVCQLKEPIQGKAVKMRDSILWTECLEKLAAQEHSQWAHWTEYMLKALHKRAGEGRCIVCRTPDPEDHEAGCLVGRWMRQIDTPYERLSEEEKESDREWAKKAFSAVLPYVQRYIQMSMDDMVREVEEAKRAFEDGRPVVLPITDKDLWKANQELQEENARLRRAISDIRTEKEASLETIKDVMERHSDPDVAVDILESFASVCSDVRDGITKRILSGEQRNEPVCPRCNDSHLMELNEREVPCTLCPTPCDECRGRVRKSAYCEETPCSCECHKERE
jgi:hypothetical protein